MHGLFDVTIFSYLIFVGAGVVGFIFFPKTRGPYIAAHPYFLRAVIILLTATWLVIAYGSFIEPRMIVRVDYNFESEKITGPVRIAAISDLHLGPYKGKNFTARLARKIEKENPDAIFLLGDFIFDNSADLSNLEPLAALAKKFTTFAVLGNHDYAGSKNFDTNGEFFSPVEEYFKSRGVRVLRNAGVTLNLRANNFGIAGTDDFIRAKPDPRSALLALPRESFKILLSHNPDAVLYLRPDDADLVLAGHTHGGQIRLPFIGALSPWPSGLDNSFDRGFFTFLHTPLLITSGAGENGPRARLFAPPEFVVLTIK